jgi:TRAP-type C4-dicarboxylate transport system permease small subunit
MSPALRKLLAILGGLLIAGGITWYPWTYWDHFTGSASSVYGMSAVIWAPAALVIGLMAGAAFAVVLWPRRPRRGPPQPEPPRDHFEA